MNLEGTFASGSRRNRPLDLACGREQSAPRTSYLWYSGYNFWS